MKVTKEIIVKKLKEIEKAEKVKILYAVESGSRAWGFESKNSDYDVRLIYIHSLDWYLSINHKRDVIERLKLPLDLSGWDVRKALNLFRNSNPPLYEWLRSPIIYWEEGTFAQKLRDYASQFYSPSACLNHYLSMAKGNFKKYLTAKKVRIKKYFYVLRPILACIWIENRKDLPPMEFEKLLNSAKLDKKLEVGIQKLLLRKKSGVELDFEDKIQVIDKFLVEKVSYFEDYSRKMIRRKPKGDIQTLNDLFSGLCYMDDLC